MYSLAELPLNCRFKTCESDLQFAIFEIQANRGRERVQDVQAVKILLKIISYALNDSSRSSGVFKLNVTHYLNYL